MSHGPCYNLNTRRFHILMTCNCGQFLICHTCRCLGWCSLLCWAAKATNAIDERELVFSNKRSSSKWVCDRVRDRLGWTGGGGVWFRITFQGESSPSLTHLSWAITGDLHIHPPLLRVADNAVQKSKVLKLPLRLFKDEPSFPEYCFSDLGLMFGFNLVLLS